jgi:hypothetical protein
VGLRFCLQSIVTNANVALTADTTTSNNSR